MAPVRTPKRLARSVGAGVATAALVCTGLTAAQASPTTWTATHTHALHLSLPALGAAPAQRHLHVSLALPLRHRSEVDSLAKAMAAPGSSHYGHFLTSREVRDRFAPTSTTVTRVRGYLAREGFSGISVSGNRLLVSGTGTVAEVQRAFHTHIGLFRQGGHTVFANTRAASVPSSLHGSVLAVLGLSNLRVALPHSVHKAGTAAAGSPDFSGFTPRAIQHAYQADKTHPASGTTVAVVTGGDMTPTIKHLRTAEEKWHFPKVPVTVEYGGPKAAITHDNPLTGNAEWDLDTQISTTVAGNVKRLFIYDVGTFTDSEVARAINLFVSQNKSRLLSASLGECDVLAFTDGAMITTDQSLAAGALQGQSMFASTGDNGFACPEVASTGVPGGPPDTSWPASGEYTAGVGGTTLLADSKGNVSNELAWIGGGGGISPFEAAPAWTLRANGAGQTWQYTNQGGRGIPDVSADADPNTGVQIYTGNSTEVIGGTSVASPLVMGLFARIDNAHRDRLGLASYQFYRVYNRVNPGTVTQGPTGPVYTPSTSPKSVPGLRDVIVGTNGAYAATPGYDYTTGVGTPLVATLSKKM